MPREDELQTGEAGALTAPPPEPMPSTSSRIASQELRGMRAPTWLPVVAIVLSLVYYYAVPSPLISLPGLLAVIVLAWLRLDLVLCLLPLTFPFWFVPKRVAGTVVFPLSEIALAVCVAVALVRLIAPPLLDSIRQWSTPSGGLHSTPPTAAELETPRASAHPASMRRPFKAAIVSAIHLNVALTRLRRAGIPVLIGAALLFAGTALGILIARRPHEALRAFRWEVAEPLLYAALILLFLRKRHLRLLVASFLGAALLLAALAAVQVFWLHVTFLPVAEQSRLIPYVTPAGSAPRATAFIFGSGNTLGAWMARALPLALALVLAPRGLPHRWRLAALVTALACVPALLWSDSRGALLAAVLACVVVGLLSLPRPRWAIGISVSSALVALIVLLANRAAVLNALLTGHNDSGTVRTLVWLAAWHMIRDHPLLGIGPDQFLYYYSSFYTNHPYWIFYQNGHRTLAWTEPNLAQPHNLILDLWLSGGLLALAGFVLVLAAFWRRCWHAYHSARASVPPAPRRTPAPGLQPAPAHAPAIHGRNSTPPAPLVRASSALHAALALGLGASVLAGILHGMVDSAYFQPDLALLFWWSVAALTLLMAREPLDRNNLPQAVGL